MTCNRKQTLEELAAEKLSSRVIAAIDAVEVETMKQGYRYKFVQCSKCHKWVAEHWLVRHVKSGCKKGWNDAKPNSRKT